MPRHAQAAEQPDLARRRANRLEVSQERWNHRPPRRAGVAAGQHAPAVADRPASIAIRRQRAYRTRLCPDGRQADRRGRQHDKPQNVYSPSTAHEAILQSGLMDSYQGWIDNQ
jgi:hypothetical protein